MTTWLQRVFGWNKDQTALGKNPLKQKRMAQDTRQPSCVSLTRQSSLTEHLLCASLCFSLNSASTPFSQHFLGRARLKLQHVYKHELLGPPQRLRFNTSGWRLRIYTSTFPGCCCCWPGNHASENHFLSHNATFPQPSLPRLEDLFLSLLILL